jgi:hypothetical protein
MPPHWQQADPNENPTANRQALEAGPPYRQEEQRRHTDKGRDQQIDRAQQGG